CGNGRTHDRRTSRHRWFEWRRLSPKHFGQTFLSRTLGRAQLSSRHDIRRRTSILSKLNQVTASLRPYPAEELGRIKKRLIDRDVPVFDFGTGDPTIPVWEPIRQALLDAVSEISQYPSIAGTELLREAQKGYLKR